MLLFVTSNFSDAGNNGDPSGIQRERLFKKTCLHGMTADVAGETIWKSKSFVRLAFRGLYPIRVGVSV